MRSLLFLLLLFITQAVSAQKTGAYDDGRRDLYYPQEIISISASPLSLFDFHNGSAYKAGFSFRPARHIRLTADGGGYIPGFTAAMTAFDNMSGYHFRGTLGYSTNYNNAGFGLSYQHKRQNFNYDARTISEQEDYTAQVTSMAHTYGAYANLNLMFSWRFYVELRAEMGVRYREITNSHNDILSDTERWNDSRFVGRIADQKGFVPSFLFSVRLNYSIWQS